MTRSIRLIGQSGGLKTALENRLSRAGANITDSENADLTIGLASQEKCDLAILPEGMHSENSNLIITLSDVIIPNGGNYWGNEIIIEWVRKVKQGELPNYGSEIRYWVNVRDVADAITIISMSTEESVKTGRMKMCGRRGWKGKYVIEEIRLLWDRYTNAINHSHTKESLSNIPSPVRGIDSGSTPSPDFQSLHSALIDSGGEGWHPLVPLRTSLMEVIASLEPTLIDSY